MGVFVDHTGRQYGRLTVIERAIGYERPHWLCQCVCGARVVVPASSLVGNCTKSCGCLRREGWPGHVRPNLPIRPLRERFERKFIVADNGCWLWTASRTGVGYGQIGLGRRGTGRADAHRVSYELYIGPIPPDAVVMHTCDVKHCVNPAHLRLGTTADNVADKMNKGRWNGGHQYGEKSGMAKLTDASVKAIRNAYEQGVRQVALAERYGVRQTTISSIVRHETWTHLP